VEISTNVANSKVGGAVLYISPHVDEKTGAVTVRASLPANAGFRPGQFVKLRIATEEHGDILAVPVESLVKDPDVGYVVAFVEKDIATQRPVRVGVRDGDFVEIEGEGIKVGQTVVSFGAYALPKMTKVRIITPND
jgi:membrane fusion protein (multidrug efflux system)